MDPTAARRASRLAAYDELRAHRSQLFVNPPGAAFEILLDRGDQDHVADQAARQMRERDIPEEYGDIGVVYQDPYVMLVRDAVRFRSGARGAYVRLVKPNDGVAAAILPVLPDGRIVLVKHFRHADRRWHWEIPRGWGEPGADGPRTARRELAEELGVTPVEVVYLGRLSTDSGTGGGYDELYLARLDSGAEDALVADPGEGIDEVRAVPPDGLTQLLSDGELVDSYTIAAFALATAHGLVDGFRRALGGPTG